MANIINAMYKNVKPPELKALVVVVNRDKGEVFANMLQEFEINAQLLISARGTASEAMLQKLGAGTPKTVILAAIREDRAKEALSFLEDKFKNIKNGKGIAFTVPFASIIGASSYEFLSNQLMEGM